MNIIKTSEYEDDYTCPICTEKFKENDAILLVKHCSSGNRSEKIGLARKRKHIFHDQCMREYIDSIQDEDILCPLDRELIQSLINVRYYEIVALNIINFSHNYYELLDKYTKKNITSVSIIDRINLNYKDVNGKTLLYCACQRGNLKLVRQLVKIGSNPVIADDNGFTPLMAAVNHNYLKIVKYLLTLPEVIAEINYVDHRGNTAIEYADQCHHLQCLKELVNVSGADHRVLNRILTKYRFAKDCDPLINEIKDSIRKYLKLLPVPKIALPITLTKSSDPPRPKMEDHDDHELSFNPDIDTHPEILDLIYQPSESNDKQLSWINQQMKL